MSAAKQPAKSQRGGLSDGAKKIILASLGAVVLIGGGVWAYSALTTMPPPKLEEASGQEVVTFLGSQRGFARMPVNDRQEYLVQAYQQLSQGPRRQEFAKALNRMNSGQRQVFVEAVFEVTKTRVVEHAREYNRLKSPRERARFVDQAIVNIERMRRPLAYRPPAQAGAEGPPPVSLAKPFEQDMPRGGDELTKAIVSHTSAKERSESQQFVDEMIVRYKELQDSGELDRILGGS